MPHAIGETGEMSSLNNNNSTISNDGNSSVSTPSSVTSSPLSSASLNTNNVVDQTEHANSFVCCTERLQNIPDVLEHIDTHHPGFINDREYGMLSVNANTTYSQYHGIPISFPNNRNNGVSGNGYLTNGKKILVSEGNSMTDFFNPQFQFQSLLDNSDFNSDYIHGLRDPNDQTVASLILGNYLSIPGSLENDPLIIGSLQYNDDSNNQYTTASSPSSSDHSSISGSLEDDSLFFGGTFPSNDDINNVSSSSSSSSSSQPSIITSSTVSSSTSNSTNNDITSASATYSPTSNNNNISSSAAYSSVSNNNYSSSSAATSLIINNAAKYIPNNMLATNSNTYVNPIITPGNSTTITSSSPTTASSLVNNSNGNTNVINQTATYNNTTNTQYSANYALYYNVPSVCTNNNGAVDYASRYPRIQPKTSITLADICVDPSKSSKKRSTTTTSSFLDDDRYNNKRRIARINEISTTMVGGVLPVPSMIVNKNFPSQSEDKYPYKCAIPGCPKAYKNANGLKYHNEHGHVEQNDNGRSKPFPCRVTGCNKSYGSKGGLIYHINHSHPQEVWALP